MICIYVYILLQHPQIHLYITESLYGTPEANTIFYVNYTYFDLEGQCLRIKHIFVNYLSFEVGGGIGMGNTCKPMADSFQCMTKSTTIKK